MGKGGGFYHGIEPNGLRICERKEKGVCSMVAIICWLGFSEGHLSGLVWSNGTKLVGIHGWG